MNKTVLIILFLFPALAKAQPADMEAAKKQVFLAAKRMNEAFVNKEYYKFSQYSHPDLINKVEGGRGGLIEITKKQVEQMEAADNMITAMWPGKASDIIDTAGEWQCTLPQYMEIRLVNGKLKTHTTIVGISPDKGANWYFVDVANTGNIDGLRELFPNLSSKLNVPPPAESVFTPSE